jgi:hypothetical protein
MRVENVQKHGTKLLYKTHDLELSYMIFCYIFVIPKHLYSGSLCSFPYIQGFLEDLEESSM